MGSPDVRAYSRNKRGIAGSLIWVNFDRHALLNLFWNAGATFLADADARRSLPLRCPDGTHRRRSDRRNRATTRETASADPPAP
jgi:hypothetical protein